jgi:hypothetical protein
MISKRALVAIVIVQFVLVLLFLVYALVQRTQALKNEELAKRAEIEARNQHELAQATAEAYKKQLEACMTRK